MNHISPLNDNERLICAISVPSKFDKSDRKSLDLLLQGSIFHNVKSYKQPTISSYLTSPTKNVSDIKTVINIDANIPKDLKKVKKSKSIRGKFQKNIASERSPKLTNMAWLLNAETSDNQNSPNKMKEAMDSSPSQKKQLNKTHCKISKCGVTKESEKKKLTNSSFAKYGIHMQSFQDILKEITDLKNYKKCFEDLTPVSTSVYIPQITKNELKSKENTLDCKYMTKEQLEEAFHTHYNYLQEICSGQRYSERHDKFMQYARYDTSKLNYNTSMIVFTIEQKQIFANLLYKEFGKASVHSNYYFQVLLPEICLKVFMEEHNMSYTEASDYLDKRPV